MIIRLVRHGETEWSRIKRIQGHKQIGLSEDGREQAEKLAEKLKSEKIRELYSSDLRRSIETCEIINRRLNLPVKQVADLREICFGEWEGKLWSEVYRNNPRLNNDWESLGLAFSAPGGETAIQFRERVQKAFYNIVSNTAFENILIVSHAQAIKVIMSCFQKVDNNELFTFIKLENCSVQTIDLNKEDILLRLKKLM